jgi:acyl transferase domain-containing protein
MFPGGGAQYVDMGYDLYQCEPTFRAQVDLCAELLEKELGYDIRTLIYPDESVRAQSMEKIKQTAGALPALFTIEYALAKLWMSWGVTPP